MKVFLIGYTEYICAFVDQILPVYDFVAVDVVETVEELMHDTLDFAERKGDFVIGEKTSQIVVAKIKDQIKGRAIAIDLRGLGPADLNQVDDVLVSEQLQDPDFAEGRDGKALLLIVHQDLFQGHNLVAVLFVLGLEDFTEGALANLGQPFVF